MLFERCRFSARRNVTPQLQFDSDLNTVHLSKLNLRLGEFSLIMLSGRYFERTCKKYDIIKIDGSIMDIKYQYGNKDLVALQFKNFFLELCIKLCLHHAPCKMNVTTHNCRILGLKKRTICHSYDSKHDAMQLARCKNRSNEFWMA